MEYRIQCRHKTTFNIILCLFIIHYQLRARSCIHISFQGLFLHHVFSPYEQNFYFVRLLKTKYCPMCNYNVDHADKNKRFQKVTKRGACCLTVCRRNEMVNYALFFYSAEKEEGSPSISLQPCGLAIIFNPTNVYCWR